MPRKLKIINGTIFHIKENGEPAFIPGELFCIQDRIVTPERYASEEGAEHILDASGSYVIPGLIDLHFHGCMGSDCCDGTTKAFETIASYELSQGITAITPATMTVSEENLSQICSTIKDFSYEQGADLCGLYMEGPFISKAKKGAQNEAFIRSADTALLEKLQALSGGKIRTVVVAPETDGALDFIQENKGRLNISLAHMASDYDTALKALSCGASQLTHLYNAMPSLHHRNPGPIAAAADTPSCMVELICDGVHIHPAMVRTTFRIFGDDRIILISDSMRATGMANGTYDLGGQEVTVTDNLAVLKDGTIAGSVTNLMDCLRIAVKKMHIPLASAIKCASYNPAKAIHLLDDHGSLLPGKYANICLLDESLKLTTLIHHGTISHTA